MGLSEIPSNSQKRLEGLCVGLFVRYPLKGRVSEGAPFEIQILTIELMLGQSAIVLANAISAVIWVAVVYAN